MFEKYQLVKVLGMNQNLTLKVDIAVDFCNLIQPASDPFRSHGLEHSPNQNLFHHYIDKRKHAMQETMTKISTLWLQEYSC